MKTTTFGMIAAVAGATAPYIPDGYRWIALAIGAAATAALGYVAADQKK